MRGSSASIEQQQQSVSRSTGFSCGLAASHRAVCTDNQISHPHVLFGASPKGIGVLCGLTGGGGPPANGCDDWRLSALLPAGGGCVITAPEAAAGAAAVTAAAGSANAGNVGASGNIIGAGVPPPALELSCQLLEVTALSGPRSAGCDSWPALLGAGSAPTGAVGEGTAAGLPPRSCRGLPAGPTALSVRRLAGDWLKAAGGTCRFATGLRKGTELRGEVGKLRCGLPAVRAGSG